MGYGVPVEHVAAEADTAHVRVGGYGGVDRDPGDLEATAVESDRVPDSDAEGVGEAALDHHPTGANPTAGGEHGLVERCRCGVAAFDHGAGREPMGFEEARR